MSLTAIPNFVMGRWVPSDPEGEILYHAVTREPLYTASSAGLDFGEILRYGRQKGEMLRKMTFQQRGIMLKKLALYLLDRKEEFYAISTQTGATRADSWVDIEGGIGNLFANASLRRQFPDLPYDLDGDPISLSKSGRFMGRHIMVPREGVAIHINAFNFPVWGMLEKIAVNLMAGVPAVVKPATLTSYLTQRVVQAIDDSGILPEGSLQLICGSARGILDEVESQDVVTFTGSASTGQKLRAHPQLISQSVPFNMEADSLNCSVLGEDVEEDMPEFDLFIKEVVREMTTKAGQKCTAIRRVLVPESKLEIVQAALGKRLNGVTLGDPSLEGVRMGPLAGWTQREEVLEKIGQLAKRQEIALGSLDDYTLVGADKEKGAFVPPIVMLNRDPWNIQDCHEIEVFGPVSTLLPYRGMEDAIGLAKLGKGSLVCSLVSQDKEIAKKFVLGASSLHGRILILNRHCGRESTGHGSPLPTLIHGGPGRAGGGEEMGGKRGVRHYLQRVALQGDPTMLTHITQSYVPGGDQTETPMHPFQKYFEELEVGDTLITAKHTVTESDISNFANLSGDRFYAHVDATSLEGTLFTQRVAHGYFVLSKAAGLFVDPKKSPVLLNYGIDEARFTKPVYPGATIGVRLTVKEKIAQEKRNEEDVAKGIVKWYVDVYDETGETVAVATILTMVKMKNQDESHP